MVTGSVDSEPVESGTEDVWSVDSEPVEAGTEDTVLVSVVGVGTTGPRLLTLVKMKGLAYWKHKRELHASWYSLKKIII